MIELQNICFEYGSEEQNIAGRGALHNINLHIPDAPLQCAFLYCYGCNAVYSSCYSSNRRFFVYERESEP